MILIPHLVIGAAIAIKIPYLPLAIALAFLSHYFLDFFPHTEYSIENLRQKQWRKIKSEIAKIIIDFIIGLMLIFLMQQLTNANLLLILAAAFFTILPDILIVLYLIFPKNIVLQKHFSLHQKTHFLKNKEFPNYWGILFQIAFVILGFVVLL